MAESSAITVDPITRTASGRAWTCATGDHRYHRDEREARWCAWRALPKTVDIDVYRVLTRDPIDWRRFTGPWIESSGVIAPERSEAR